MRLRLEGDIVTPDGVMAGHIDMEQGRVVAVAGTPVAAECAGAGGRPILLPGFIESHGHPAMLARTLLEVDVTPQSAGSIAAIQDAVAAAVQDPPADGWIRGAGWLVPLELP